jgi:FMN reductase
MHVLIVSCSLNPRSRSRILARTAEERLQERGIQTAFVDLREANLPFCDGDSAYATEPAKQVAKQVQEADAILLAVPIYNFDVNAACKNLIELTGTAWKDKVVGFLCAAGGKTSYMGPLKIANSLMLDFRTIIVPRFVYAEGVDFREDVVASEQVLARIEEVASTLVRLAEAINPTLQAADS